MTCEKNTKSHRVAYLKVAYPARKIANLRVKEKPEFETVQRIIRLRYSPLSTFYFPLSATNSTIL
jgi:hypothetical protein